jgi:hypothetical protein
MIAEKFEATFSRGRDKRLSNFFTSTAFAFLGLNIFSAI